MLCGCQGVNGGGWAHYVGQEKVRPLTGFQQVAFGLDWQRPTRHMTGTSFFYLHTDQWRYERFGADELASPLGRGLFAGRTFADCLAQAVADGLDARRTRRSTATRSTSPTRPPRPASRSPSTWSTSCRPAGCGSPARTRTTRRTSRG